MLLAKCSGSPLPTRLQCGFQLQTFENSGKLGISSLPKKKNEVSCFFDSINKYICRRNYETIFLKRERMNVL